MSGHTQEPWDVRPIEHDKSLILGAPDGFCSDMIGTVHRPDNARRIVAAVNSTAGISTEALESGVIAELVEALGMANAAINAMGRQVDAEWRNNDKASDRNDAVVRLFREKARATLAKVKGETA